MRQSILRRVTGPGNPGNEVLGDQRLSSWPRAGGWPVLAPPFSPRAHMHRGPQQATEMGAGAGRGVGVIDPVTASFIVKGVGMAIAGITAWIRGIKIRNAQKVGATTDANEAERKIQELLEAWNASAKTRSEQVAALAAFDAIWAWLISPAGCGNAQLGTAGQRCISERSAGGTVPGTGGNWFVWYRDPIAHDPNVIPDPAAGSTITRNPDGTVVVTPPAGGAGLPGVVAGIPISLLIAGAAIVLALTMGGKR